MAGKKNIKWKVGEIVTPQVPVDVQWYYSSGEHRCSGKIRPGARLKIREVKKDYLVLEDLSDKNICYVQHNHVERVATSVVVPEKLLESQKKAESNNVPLTTADRPGIVREAANKGKIEGFGGAALAAGSGILGFFWLRSYVSWPLESTSIPVAMRVMAGFGGAIVTLVFVVGFIYGFHLIFDGCGDE